MGEKAMKGMLKTKLCIEEAQDTQVFDGSSELFTFPELHIQNQEIIKRIVSNTMLVYIVTDL